MKTFKDLKLESRGDELDGIQGIEFFDNGYGVSVIRGSWTYGGEKDLYELAVIKGDIKKWDIDYVHPESEGDVRGHLTEDDITTIMENVQNTEVVNE